MKNVRNHEKEITGYTLRRIKEVDNVETYGPENIEVRGGVVSFNIKGVHAHDTATILNSFGVAVRSGYVCAQPLTERIKSGPITRASFYIYNTKEEVDVFIDALKKTGKVFK